MLTSVGSWQKFLADDGPGRPVRFAAHGQPFRCNFLYHSRIILSVGGSLWYLVRNSVAPSQLTHFWQIPQNVLISPVLAMFRRNCPLVVKPASTPWLLLPKQTWRDFCCVCLDCCAAEFRNSGGTYEISCIFNFSLVCAIITNNWSLSTH
jgi:hypothetical protein